MTATDELERWIAKHGSARDALNVALAQIARLKAELRRVEYDMDTMQRLEWLVGNAAPCGVTIQRFGGHVYCTVLPTNDISMPTGVGDTLAAAIEDCFIEAGGPEEDGDA